MRHHSRHVSVSKRSSRGAVPGESRSDGPVDVVSIACSERMDWPDPDRLRAAMVEKAG